MIAKTRYIAKGSQPQRLPNRVCLLLNGVGMSYSGSYQDLRGNEKIERQNDLIILIAQNYDQAIREREDDAQICVASFEISPIELSNLSKIFDVVIPLDLQEGEYFDIDINSSRPKKGHPARYISVQFGGAANYVYTRSILEELRAKRLSQPDPIIEQSDPLPEEIESEDAGDNSEE